MRNKDIDIGVDLGGVMPESKIVQIRPRNKEDYQVDDAAVSSYLDIVRRELGQCSTDRDVLKKETAKLAECTAIATQIYQQFPVPENAYSLASLSNAYKSSLAQLEKMHDPETMANSMETLIKNMFVELIKALSTEINKAKAEFMSVYPEDKDTFEEAFSRMVSAVQPETQKLFDDLNERLRDTLGVKTSGKK